MEALFLLVPLLLNHDALVAVTCMGRRSVVGGDLHVRVLVALNVNILSILGVVKFNYGLYRLGCRRRVHFIYQFGVIQRYRHREDVGVRHDRLPVEKGLV